MKRTNEITTLVDNLAGHWTEPALEIFKAIGIHPISVGMEVEAWQTLKIVLLSEFRWQRAFRLSTMVSLGMVMEQVIRKATLLVAKKFQPNLVSDKLERQIRQFAAERRSTAAERRLYAEIIRQPAVHPAFKPPSRTDFTPRLRVSVVA